MDKPILLTARLLLRPFRAEDAQALYDMLADEKVNRYLPEYPLNDLDEARAYIARMQQRYRDPEAAWYAVCMKGGDQPIGSVTLKAGGARDLGYALNRQAWHQGIAAEAAAAVLNRARTLGLPFVTATHDVNNPNSGRVMQKLGMRYQYSYEELWQPKNFLVVFRMYQIIFSMPPGYVYEGYKERYPNHFIEPNVD